MTEATDRRDWDFARDGDLDGMYVETRQVTIRNGPSAGQTKPVLDFHVGPDDELVTVWPSKVLRRKLRDELKLRRKPDFEPGERMRIHRPREQRIGPNGGYWDDRIAFEHAAPKPKAVDLLADAADDDQPAADDGDIPF